MMKPKTSVEAHAALFATFQAIKHGKVGLNFQGPDTCEIEWTPEAISHVVQAIWAVDEENVFRQWIEDLLHEAGTPPARLLRRHPDYGSRLSEFEDEMREYEG